MIRFCLLLVVLLPCRLSAQQKLYVGVNTFPLIFQTIDVRLERQISDFWALQSAIAFRAQGREVGEAVRFSLLQGYIQPRNRAVSLSLGARYFDSREIDYPYLAADLTLGYYNETIELNDSTQTGITRDVSGWKWGVSVTIGYVIWLTQRLRLDLGFQLGYTPPRDEVLAFYMPGMGFTTFGFNRFGARGLIMQPQLTLKYNLIRDRRARLRQME